MKRRTFITTAAGGFAAAGAGPVRARKPAIGGRTLDRDFIRVGILGLGPYSHAADYIRVINSEQVPPRTSLRVTAVWGKAGGYASSFRGTPAFVEEQVRLLDERNDIQRFQWEYGVEHIAGDPEMMIDQVDAVFVTDPEDSLQLARPFLIRGMPVFVDSPVAWSLDEVQELVDTARSNNATLVGGSYLPWLPEVRAAASRIDRNILQHYYIDGHVERFCADMPGIIETALQLSGGEVAECHASGVHREASVDPLNPSPAMLHLTYRQRTPESEPVVGVVSSWHTEDRHTWMKVHMNRQIVEQSVMETAADNPLDRDEHRWLPQVMGIARAFEMGAWPESGAAVIDTVRVMLMAHLSGIEGGAPVTPGDVGSHQLPRLIG